MVAVEGSVHTAAAAVCLPTNRISSRLYLLITWPRWSTQSAETKTRCIRLRSSLSRRPFRTSQLWSIVERGPTITHIVLSSTFLLHFNRSVRDCKTSKYVRVFRDLFRSTRVTLPRITNILLGDSLSKLYACITRRVLTYSFSERCSRIIVRDVIVRQVLAFLPHLMNTSFHGECR